ncbi:MAG: hypothetical protein ACD_21C00103G0001 [uncultured bacterium]|nr:MAG: hypothetical protein ACD_21C00103G0001 [uncultured bacterium]
MIFYLTLWILYIVVAVVTVWVYWFAPTGSITDYVQAAVYVIAPAIAVLGGLLTVKEYGWKSTAGRIFLIITLGLACWLIGEGLWTYYDLVLKIDPFPSVADWFYFIAYIPLSIGLLWQYKFLHKTAHTPLGYTQRLLLTMVAVLLSGIALYFGVFKSIQPEHTLFENVVAMGYGVADVILVLVGLVITIVTIEMRGGKFASAWWWFLFGIFCTFIADIAFAMYTPQYEIAAGFYKPALDTIWIVGYLSMGYGLGQFGWLVQGVRERAREQNNLVKK